MRSIGKKNRNLVKRLTGETINKRKDFRGIVDSYMGIEKEVIELLPVELWDTWEGCDQEIRGIIDDTIQNP